MKITENSQKNVLIIGSGSMGYGDQRIHDMWIDKFNLFSKVEHESSIKKGKYKPLIIYSFLSHDVIFIILMLATGCVTHRPTPVGSATPDPGGTHTHAGGGLVIRRVPGEE